MADKAVDVAAVVDEGAVAMESEEAGAAEAEEDAVVVPKVKAQLQ